MTNQIDEADQRVLLESARRGTRALTRFERRSSLRSWLYSIATNEWWRLAEPGQSRLVACLGRDVAGHRHPLRGAMSLAPAGVLH